VANLVIESPILMWLTSLGKSLYIAGRLTLQEKKGGATVDVNPCSFPTNEDDLNNLNLLNLTLSPPHPHITIDQVPPFRRLPSACN
jgi:hypothetical protein